MFAVKTSVTDQRCTDWELTMTHHFITLKNHIQQWQYLCHLMAPPAWVTGGLIRRVLGPYADFCGNLHVLYTGHVVTVLDRGWSARRTV